MLYYENDLADWSLRAGSGRPWQANPLWSATSRPVPPLLSEQMRKIRVASRQVLERALAQILLVAGLTLRP